VSGPRFPRGAAAVVALALLGIALAALGFWTLLLVFAPGGGGAP
jgi:hypothetical protein